MAAGTVDAVAKALWNTPLFWPLLNRTCTEMRFSLHRILSPSVNWGWAKYRERTDQRDILSHMTPYSAIKTSRKGGERKNIHVYGIC